MLFQQLIGPLPCIDIYQELIAIAIGDTVNIYDAYKGDCMRSLSLNTKASPSMLSLAIPYVRFDGRRIMFCAGNAVATFSMPATVVFKVD